jgi:hypothetical protein
MNKASIFLMHLFNKLNPKNFYKSSHYLQNSFNQHILNPHNKT